ncbi:MAG TPA: hypothetical protein ENF81_01410, partial [Thermotogaceae bacterium]|nr:hypothetical protein [Thermotogaceae bacterium]
LIGYVDIERQKPKGQLQLDLFVNEEQAEYIVERIKVVSELKSHLEKTANALEISGNVVNEVKDLNRILLKEQISWHDFEKVLRTKEKLIRILIASLNSQHAKPLNELLSLITKLFNQKLDEKFAEEHEIKLEDLKQIKTFHWVFEFPEVFLDRGGFDVVVGNPPYVELNEIDYVDLFVDDVKNLYDAFVRLSINVLKNNGMFGFIHANSAYCQPKFKSLRDFLYKNANDFIIINFAIRPQPVFKGVMQRTAITICRKDPSEPKKVKTSRYIRLTEENRNQILENPPIYDSSNFVFKFDDFIPKIGNEIDYRIFSKLFSNSMTLGDIIDNKNGVPIYYHDSGESYWTKALNYEPKGIRNGQEVRASQWFVIKIELKYADFVLCAINSTLFYWFWLTVSDCRHLTQETIKQFPIPSENAFSSEILGKLKEASSKLMECYQKNSYYVEKRKGYESLEFKVNRCKKAINEIDRLIGLIYWLTDEEVEYLVKYDEEMRVEDRL